MVAATMRIRVGRLLLLTLMLALCTPMPVAAATVRVLEVTHNKEIYIVTFDVLVAAEAASVAACSMFSLTAPKLGVDGISNRS